MPEEKERYFLSQMLKEFELANKAFMLQEDYGIPVRLKLAFQKGWLGAMALRNEKETEQ